MTEATEAMTDTDAFAELRYVRDRGTKASAQLVAAVCDALEAVEEREATYDLEVSHLLERISDLDMPPEEWLPAKLRSYAQRLLTHYARETAAGQIGIELLLQIDRIKSAVVAAERRALKKL